MPIAVPKGVEITLGDDQITVKGANGTLNRQLHALVKLNREADTITAKPANDSVEANAMSGSANGATSSMVTTR
jgi:large subunit ribosomal protein L6